MIKYYGFLCLVLVLPISTAAPQKKTVSLNKLLENVFSQQPPGQGVFPIYPVTPSFTDLVTTVFSTQPPGHGIFPTNPVTPTTDQPDINEPSYKPCGDDNICVPFYLCNNRTKKVNRDGTDLIDIRFGKEKDCSSYLETCCSLENKLSKPDVKPIERPKGCGHRNAEGILFKITGQRDGETEYGEFPWMIAVLKEERAGDNILNIYQGGGSLIHPSVVLTAAHCVHKHSENSLIVRAGEWDTQTKDEIFREQDRQVIQIIPHEKFSRGGVFNDIALLFTSSAFDLGLNVNTVCLPPPNMNFDNSRCFATGWGKDTFGHDGQYQVILKKVDLPIVPRHTCEPVLRGTRLGTLFNLHESFICAGGELGKDTCKGDGGSPLSCEIPGEKNKFYQTGIVAWGIGCGDEIPGVYASVPYLRSWIDSQFTARNLDQSYYTAV